jgi:uroporphyrinogen decarboxylase
MTRPSMSPRERVMTAMRRQIPDRVPFDLTHGFTAPRLEHFHQEIGNHDPNEYFGGDARVVDVAPSRFLRDYSRYFENFPPHATVDEWGIGHLPTSSDDPWHAHLEGFIYPMLKLRTREDALAYPLPDVEAEYRFADLAPQISRYHGQGLAVIGFLEMTIFEVAWYMRSMELLLMDFVDNPEFADTLLDRITAKREAQAARYTELGVDLICLGDDVGTQQGMLMSVPMWRRWLKPRLARVIAAAKHVRPGVLINYHSDGNMEAVIPELIEIGVDILNPVQPECLDPRELKSRYGDHLSFWGAIGIQHTLPFGTPAEVREEVRTRIETVGAGGGLLIGPTHIVEPEVPLENIVAMVEAVKEYGTYH